MGQGLSVHAGRLSQPVNGTCSFHVFAPQQDEVFTLLQNSIMSTTESISEFILRRLTMNELSTVSIYFSNFSLFISILSDY